MCNFISYPKKNNVCIRDTDTMLFSTLKIKNIMQLVVCCKSMMSQTTTKLPSLESVTGPFPYSDNFDTI